MNLLVFSEEINKFKMKDPWGVLYIGNKVRMYNAGEEVATLDVMSYGSVLLLSFGETNPKFRRLGIGTWIRAIATWAAKRVGFKKVVQESVFLPNTPKTPRPTSAYIMNKLGFSINKISSNKSENRSLNLNRNIKNVNAVIRNIRG
jgi:hypothetical protein